MDFLWNPNLSGSFDEFDEDCKNGYRRPDDFDEEVEVVRES